MVIGEEPEELLAPFNEQDEEYMVFVDKSDEVRAEWKANEIMIPDSHPAIIQLASDEFRKAKLADMVETSRFEACHIKVGGTVHLIRSDGGDETKDELFSKVKSIKDLKGGRIRLTLTKGEKPVEKSIQETYGTLDKFAEEYHGYQKLGRYYGCMHNEHSKWDWYSLGGRWKGSLIHKPKSECRFFDDIKKGDCGAFAPATKAHSRACDQVRKCDIDLTEMRKIAAADAKAYWAEKHDKKDMHPCIDDMEVAKLSERAYVARAKSNVLLPFAWLDKDNGWVERGSMGWWGIVSDEKDESTWGKTIAKLWKPVPEDALVSIYDCHV
jgi:hypothetical protein